MATPEHPPAESAPGVVRALGLAVVAGLLGALVAALITGATAPLQLADPGALVRWGLPLVSAVSTLASAATVGLLGLAAFLVPERKRTNRRVTATRYAATAATVWAVAALLEVVLTFADLAGTPLTSAGLFDQLVSFTWTLETTRVLLISALVAVVVAVSARFTTRRAPMAWLAVLTLAAVVILALTGHAAGSTSHEDAVNALGVHLLGVVVWTGGLIGLVALRRPLGTDLGTTVARYSTVAAWCFAAVALSGVQQAWIRVGSLEGLTTPYGIVVRAQDRGDGGARRARLAAPAQHRRGAHGAARRRAGVRPARGRRDHDHGGRHRAGGGARRAACRPVADAAPAPSRILELSGYPDPGPMVGADWITAWRIDWLFLSTAALAVGLYLAGVVRLRRRGDAWPPVRTICWVARVGPVRVGHLWCDPASGGGCCSARTWCCTWPWR